MTSTRLRSLASLAALLLMVAGCGSRVDVAGELAAHREGQSSVPTAQTTMTSVLADETPGRGDGRAPQDAAATDSDAPVQDGAAQAAAATDPPVPEAPSGEGADGPTPPTGIITSIEPECVERPGTVVVIIETVAFADVAYGAAFSDHDHHGQWGLGQTDRDGRLRWEIAVGPTIPDGAATLTATGHNPETGGGSGQGQFLVAPPGGC